MILRIIILIIGLWLLIIKRKSFTSTFTNNKNNEEIHKLKEPISDYSNILGSNVVIISFFIVICMLSMFYLMSAIFINNIIFTIISICNVTFLFRTVYQLRDFIKDTTNGVIPIPNPTIEKINYIMDLIYVVFVIVMVLIKF